MLELIEAGREQETVLRNLLEKYLCEFSQWEQLDVDEDGLYGYEWLDYYFAEEPRHAYLIRVDGKLAGLVMVSNYPEVPEEPMDYAISEFFILPKYRRQGYGKAAFFRVLDLHPGKWQLKRHPKNRESVYFWNQVIAEYTGGKYRLVEAYPNEAVNYCDGTPADVFFFEN
ncbi:MAG: GNAT family N-acetyltransferase [Ruminococcaceae bacterium]|nr:GNAT family N-acetyltransferase [Oscillospiraceae bacterium]